MIINLSILKSAIEKSWSKETCYPNSSHKWTSNNPALGQCAITALIIQDYFGGEIIYCWHLGHYWNKLPDGKIIDLTISQFSKDIIPCQDELRSREYILESDSSKNALTKNRYLLLKSKVLNILKKESNTRQ